MEDKLKHDFWKATQIKPCKYKKINLPDYVPRIEIELGKKMIKDPHDGHSYEVWTNFKVWCYEANIRYPIFRIKIQLSNKEGSGFSEITIGELDNLIAILTDWRKNNDNLFAVAEANSTKLQRAALTLARTEEVLNNPNEDLSLLNDILAGRIKTKQHKEDINSMKAHFGELYESYMGSTTEIQKKYYMDLLRELAPVLKKSLDKQQFAELTQIDPQDYVNIEKGAKPIDNTLKL